MHTWTAILLAASPLAGLCGAEPDPSPTKAYEAEKPELVRTEPKEPTKDATPAPATPAVRGALAPRPAPTITVEAPAPTPTGETPLPAVAPAVIVPVDPPPDAPIAGCPDLPLPQRFTGQVAGLAWVSQEQSRAHWSGSVPGDAPAGPEPLPPLTVVRTTGSEKRPASERNVYAATEPGQSTTLGFDLKFDAIGDDERLMFVTSACLPNPAAQLTAWTFVPLTRPPDDFEALKKKVDAHIAGRLKGADRAAFNKRGGIPPAGLGAFTTRIPGCGRLLVASVNVTFKLAYDEVSAVLCLDGDTLTDVVAPKRGRMLPWAATSDLDGDGREEAVVETRTFDKTKQYVVTTTHSLLWWGQGGVSTHALSHVDHGG